MKLIEASAGTGKTHWIAERVRALVEAGTPLRRIAVLSFSEAAVAELRGRVHRALSQASSEAARAALANLDQAAILTLHAFSERCLEAYPLLGGREWGLEQIGSLRGLAEEIATDFWVQETARLPATAVERVQELRGSLVRVVEKAFEAELEVRPKPPNYAPPPLEWWAQADPQVRDDTLGQLRDSLRHRLLTYAREEGPRRLQARAQQGFQSPLDALARAVDDPALVEALRARWERVIVDEFQDTDPTQWHILREAFGDRLELLGDPKQAIYAFRGGDVFTYLSAARAAERGPRLAFNYRSDGPYLRALARLFERPGLFGASELDALPVDAAQPARSTLPGPLLRLRAFPREGGRPLDASRSRQLPQRVARDLAAFLAAGHEVADDYGVLRPVEPGDLAVLVGTNDQAAQVQGALRALGLPSILRSRESVFASATCHSLIRLLQGVLSPERPGFVRGALTCDLIAMDCRALAAMEAEGGQRAWADEVERLRGWRAVWATQGFGHLSETLLRELRLEASLPRLAGGARALTDLLHLFDLLAEAERARHLRPAGLLAWLRGGGEGLAKELAWLRPEGEDGGVHVLTTHASKGRSFGFVWLPYAWRRPRPDAEVFLFHHLGKRMLELGRRPLAAHVKARDEEAHAEGLRLLYVALTRARHGATLYWGEFRGAGGSPLTDLLFGAAGVEARETARRVTGASDAELLQRLGELGPEIEVEASSLPPVGPATPWTPPYAEPPKLHTRPFERSLDATWRRTSFSALTREGGAGIPVHDHDADLLEQEPRPGAGGLVPLHDFISGAAAGTLIHHILEHHDFTRPEALEALVHQQCVLHGFPLDRATGLAEGLQIALEAPILGDLRLADLSRAKRLDEMEFFMPTAGGFEPREGLNSAELAALIEANPGPGLPPEYPDLLRELHFPRVRGFMNGAIDLVFEHEGRWYVVDYKSNRLGPTWGDYAPQWLAESMASHHYVLQYHLYGLATHRYLRQRIPDYDYERHFGGAIYLFLRGMGAEQPGSGVFRDRPPLALVEALEAKLL